MASGTQDFPQRLPSLGGEIVIADAQGRAYFDEAHDAPARRAGDFVYISGVVVGRAPDGERTPEMFRIAALAGFARLNVTLEAFGLSFDDVVMVNTFHDWIAEEFGGERAAQGQAFVKVKHEAMGGARPAWTAVGTSGLWSESYIVEIQMIAYAPQARS